MLSSLLDLYATDPHRSVNQITLSSIIDLLQPPEMIMRSSENLVDDIEQYWDFEAFVQLLGLISVIPLIKDHGTAEYLVTLETGMPFGNCKGEWRPQECGCTHPPGYRTATALGGRSRW
jgi:hypothetical protein